MVRAELGWVGLRLWVWLCVCVLVMMSRYTGSGDALHICCLFPLITSEMALYERPLLVSAVVGFKLWTIYEVQFRTMQLTSRSGYLLATECCPTSTRPGPFALMTRHTAAYSAPLSGP
jgi:hypothetical protein